MIIDRIGSNYANNKDAGKGVYNEGSVSDSNTLNEDYLDHLYTYSVNADGSYSIKLHGAAKDSAAKSATIYNGVVSFTDVNNVVVNTNNSTIFLVKDLLTGKYTKYEGKAAVPAMTNATVCYLKASNGYASVVVVSDYKLATNTFVAYVKTSAKTNSGTYIDGTWYYAYDAYKLGETTATPIYTTLNNQIFNGAVDGFYLITVDTNSAFVSGGIATVVTPLQTTGSHDGNSYVYNEVSIDTKDGTLVTETAGNFGVSDADVYTLTYDNGVSPSTLEIAKSTEENALDGDKVYVVYNANSDTHEASYVYIVKNDNSEIGTDPAAPATLALDKSASSNEFTATLTEGGTALSGVVVKLTVTANGVTSSPVVMDYVAGTTYQYTATPTINSVGTYVVTATAYMNGAVVATATWQGV